MARHPGQAGLSVVIVNEEDPRPRPRIDRIAIVIATALVEARIELGQSGRARQHHILVRHGELIVVPVAVSPDNARLDRLARSDESRVGNVWDSTVRTGWSTYH